MYQRTQAMREVETELSWHVTEIIHFFRTVIQVPFELTTQVKYALFSVSIFIENPRIFIQHYKQFGVERFSLEAIQSSKKTVTWFL